MITDKERREVARRLREIDVGSIWYGYELLEEVADCIGDEGVKYGTSYGKFVVRLADLIEPGCDRDTPKKVAEEMFGKMRHSTKGEAGAYDAMLKSKSVEVHPVDRDALLKLADEMEGDARYWLALPCDQLGSHDVLGYARLIREALGVVE